ncbi:MAG: DNA polymerase/3'-5' exonuclease PolX [Phycisphaerales bacterium]|nr:DNA polymerase/3'-5' exonuclease PolX [Phycisphaerales bacterium]
MATNKECAAAFFTIADFLEITGANGFKVNAYRKAARVCEDESADLGKLARETPAKLREIDGIGEGTAAKIIELETTGAISELEALRGKIPVGLPALLTLQGLGPKTVKLLWDEAKVTSLDDLLAAIDSGALASIPRMGAKTIANLRDAAAAHVAAAANPTRYRLGEALPWARAILARLACADGSIRTAFAGSARRGRESVGDLDLLVSTTNPTAAREAFLKSHEIAKVLVQGETKCAVQLRVGIQVDLRIVRDDAFGAALMYFTGSKDHNIFLRERAIERNMRLNEYGLFRTPPDLADGSELALIAAESEESIYHALDLPCYPPELRETYTTDFTREPPQLIDVGDVCAELHAHTTASDGSLSIRELAELAKSRGFHTIAVTDHSRASAQANGLSIDRLLRHIDAIREVEADLGGIRILAGSEVDILADGRLDYDDDTLARLDVVVASPHTALKQSREAATARLLAAIRHPLVHILGHPTGRIINGRSGLEPDMDLLCEAARECGTALEINCHAMRLDLRDSHVRTATRAGCLIAIDCDIHRVEDADNLELGIATARRGGVIAAGCINTWPAPQLHAWLARKRTALGNRPSRSNS